MVCILLLIGLLKYFDLIYVMIEGGFLNVIEFMVIYMYKNVFVLFKMGYGSIIVFVMFMIIIIVGILVYFVIKRREV